MDEIMNNEVVETATEEIATKSATNGFKVAGVAGLIIVGGIAAYHYGVKPLIAKAKAKKAAAEEETDEVED